MSRSSKKAQCLTKSPHVRVLFYLAALAGGLIGLHWHANASELNAAGAGWQPGSAERLVKLPAGYLTKAVERDFAASGLAIQMDDAGALLDEHTASLRDLQAAADAATGDLRDELRHQALVAKRGYVETMSRRLDLERQRIETRVRLFEDMLSHLDRQTAQTGPDMAQLQTNRDTALKRFEAVQDKIDLDLVARGSSVEETRYSAAYRKHADAVRTAGGHDRQP